MIIKVDITYSRMFEIEIDCTSDALKHEEILEAINKFTADHPNNNDNLEWCGTMISDEDDNQLADWS